MRLQRCGRTYRMTARVTSGLWDVFYTKWLRCSPRFAPKTWMDCLKINSHLPYFPWCFCALDKNKKVFYTLGHLHYKYESWNISKSRVRPPIQLHLVLPSISISLLLSAIGNKLKMVQKLMFSFCLLLTLVLLAGTSSAKIRGALKWFCVWK